MAARTNKGKPKIAGGVPIDTTRPKIKNKDGSFSTERTITVGFDKGVFNIPTIIGGKQRSDEEAVKHFKKTGKHVGKFRSIVEAEQTAKQRSKRIGKLRK